MTWCATVVQIAGVSIQTISSWVAKETTSATIGIIGPTGSTSIFFDEASGQASPTRLTETLNTPWSVLNWAFWGTPKPGRFPGRFLKDPREGTHEINDKVF